MVVISTMAQAQGIGIQAGLNLSKWEGDDIDRSDMRTGYHFGVVYEHALGEKLRLQPGLFLSKAGTQEEVSESYEITEYTSLDYKDRYVVNTLYLDMPVSFKYLMEPKVYLSITPAMSFLLDNDVTYTYLACIDNTCTGEEEKDEFDQLRTVDVGIGFGIGYKVVEQIDINAGYRLGLLTLDKERDAEIFNRNLTFSLAFYF